MARGLFFTWQLYYLLAQAWGYMPPAQGAQRRAAARLAQARRLAAA